MRGKRVLAGAAVVALVVLAGTGGLSKAVAGVRHWMGTTKTVTKLCVYVDRTDRGQSYGDVSVLPKYNHKICIAGKQGLPGDTSVITWSKTSAAAAPPAAGRPGTTSGTVDLAKVGPFTIRGYCSSVEGVSAVTDVISGQDGSTFMWNGTSVAGTFNSGTDETASVIAYGSSDSPGYQNESDYGDFSASTADGTTAFTGSANNGVYLNGPNGPACSFTGYVVLENAPAAG